VVLLTEIERIAMTETQVSNMEGWMKSHEKRQNSSLEKIDERLEKIEKKIDNQLNSRPTWAVSIFITLLSSLCVGLFINSLK
jgi:tetrahydromethanopterin S-methyltransferase subunit G